MAIQRQQNPKHGDPVATVIGEGIQVVGRIDGREDLRVQGYIEGTVHLSEALIIDAGGIVVGGARVRELVVHGVLVGDAIASGRIVLHPGARVVGDLQAPRIVVHPGAAVRGQLSMGEGDDETPQEASGGGRQGMGRWRTSARVASSSAPAPRPAARPVRATRSAAARPTGLLARGRAPEVAAEPGPRVPPQRARPSVRESIREQLRERAPAPEPRTPEPRELRELREPSMAAARDREDGALEELPDAYEDEVAGADEGLEDEDAIDVDDGTITTSNGKKQAARPRVPARGKHSVEG